LGILWFLQMTLETTKELIGITFVRDDEEEVSNVKCMHVGEEEVLLSLPKTATVPPEEEEVPVPQGPSIMVPSEEEVPPEEEEPPAPAIALQQASPIAVPPEEEEVPTAPLVTVPPEGRGCLVPVPPLVSSSPFFFSEERRRFVSPFFS
jgi:hypothetical protein